ncbi:MAG: nucleotidyltransferase family protein [Acidobacteriota bacterium]
MDRIVATTRPVEKAVILAAGLGTRMRKVGAQAALEPEQSAVADAGIKAMIPFGRPFLDYVLSGLADARVGEVCIVVAPGDRSIREHYAASPPERMRLCFAVQPEPRGTADAVLAAEGFVGDSDFLSLNSDNYYPIAAYRALQELDGPGLPVFDREELVRHGHITRHRVNRYAVLRIDPEGFLEQIEEKPDAAAVASLGERVLVSMNLWRFSPAIFEACRRVPISSRGELELPQAVQWAVRRLQQRFRAVPCEGAVLDLSTRGDIAAVAGGLRGVEVRL